MRLNEMKESVSGRQTCHLAVSDEPGAKFSMVRTARIQHLGDREVVRYSSQIPYARRIGE